LEEEADEVGLMLAAKVIGRCFGKIILNVNLF
jgi:hypothetical protein